MTLCKECGGGGTTTKNWGQQTIECKRCGGTGKERTGKNGN